MTTTLSTSGRIKQIVDLHELATLSAKKSIEYAIEIGQLLTEQKESLNHGEWIPWVEDNLPFDRRQASNYMRLFDSREELSNGNHVSHLPMREAVQMLSTPKEEPLKTTYKEVDEDDSSLDPSHENEATIIEAELESPSRNTGEDLLQATKEMTNLMGAFGRLSSQTENMILTTRRFRGDNRERIMSIYEKKDMKLLCSILKKLENICTKGNENE